MWRLLGGEIWASSAASKGVFGRKNVQLLTEDGRLLDFSFFEKALLPASDVAYVDVTGELPIAHPKLGRLSVPGDDWSRRPRLGRPDPSGANQETS